MNKFVSKFEKDVFESVQLALNKTPKRAYSLVYKQIENSAGFHGCEIMVIPKNSLAASLVISAEREFEEIYIKFGNCNTGDIYVKKNSYENKISFVHKFCEAVINKGMCETLWTFKGCVIFSKGVVVIFDKKAIFRYGSWYFLLFFWRCERKATTYQAYQTRFPLGHSIK